MSGRREKALRRAAGIDLKVERQREIDTKKREADELKAKLNANHADIKNRLSARGLVAVATAMAVGP